MFAALDPSNPFESKREETTKKKKKKSFPGSCPEPKEVSRRKPSRDSIPIVITAIFDWLELHATLISWEAIGKKRGNKTRRSNTKREHNVLAGERLRYDGGRAVGAAVSPAGRRRQERG